jgi:hypothetical protein
MTEIFANGVQESSMPSWSNHPSSGNQKRFWSDLRTRAKDLDC